MFIAVPVVRLHGIGNIDKKYLHGTLDSAKL